MRRGSPPSQLASVQGGHSKMKHHLPTAMTNPQQLVWVLVPPEGPLPGASQHEPTLEAQPTTPLGRETLVLAVMARLIQIASRSDLVVSPCKQEPSKKSTTLQKKTLGLVHTIHPPWQRTMGTVARALPWAQGIQNLFCH